MRSKGERDEERREADKKVEGIDREESMMQEVKKKRKEGWEEKMGRKGEGREKMSRGEMEWREKGSQKGKKKRNIQGTDNANDKYDEVKDEENQVRK